jgi:serine/threonine-protein kinase
MAASPERWRLVEELFHRAAEADPTDRPRLLDELCAADPELRRELESLLASADTTLEFLRRPVEQAAAAITQAEPVREGKVVGAYRLIRLLGEGGMGTVYLAARADEQYQRQVAIKVLHAAFALSQAMLLRFRSERQILANLDHPNIAHLLDGGVTPDGLPYLVMEYVDGIPIHEYCRRHELGVPARLRLFRTVCAAVEYAHHNLVVHRDIKPANILVTADGTPKLLDFGIAKLLDPTLDTAAPTRTADRMMTPEYASPEQILGEPVTTLTDVYGLAVLLYELLADKRPFAVGTRSPLEIARMVCQEEPEPPGISPDIDRIVLMGMRKEPGRRYASAAEFASDVQAWLDGFPLRARTDSLGYRAERFVRRHRTAAAVAILAVVLLVGFSIAMGILARRANREQALAQREADFLAGMFRAATPEVARGHVPTARDLLDRGAERVDRELAAEPEVRASMLQNIAAAYRSLGLFDGGLAIAKRAYDLEARLYGAGNPKLAAALELVAELDRDKARYKEAEPLLRQVVAMRRKTLRPTDLLLARSLAYQGNCLYEEDKDQEAEPILREALAAYRANGPDQGPDARNYLALLLERKGEYEEAQSLLREAVEITRRTSGPDSPEYALALHNLAGALIDMGNLNGAEATLRESLAIRRKVLGNDHPELFYSLNNLGFVLVEKGEPDAAAPYLRESLDLCLARYGEVHPRTGGARNGWARVLLARGDYDGAEREFRQSLDIFQKIGGPVSWNTASVLSNLGLVEIDRGHFAEADKFVSQALEMRRKLGGEDTPFVAGTLIELGEIRLLQKDGRAAEPLLREALKIRRRKFGERHPAVIGTEVLLGEAMTLAGAAPAAEPVLRAALAVARSARFPLQVWQVAEAETALGVCLKRLGRSAEGEKFIRESQLGLQKHPMPARRRPLE